MCTWFVLYNGIQFYPPFPPLGKVEPKASKGKVEPNGGILLFTWVPWKRIRFGYTSTFQKSRAKHVDLATPLLFKKVEQNM
jgi:hypothetical protein